MNPIYFDSKNEKFKSPFGAIKTGEACNFSIYIAQSLMPSAVNIVVRKGIDNSSQNYYMQKTSFQDGFDIFSCRINFDTPDLYFYRFEITTPDGIKFVGLKDKAATIGDWLPEWQLTVYSAEFTTPDWVKGGIMYQIFPDRFKKSDDFSPLPAKNERKIHDNWYEIPDFIYNTPIYKANDFFCGNIPGIMEMLPYIKELGVNIIYLNPVFESPENHRYSTGNYLNIDPWFGTNELFEKFTEKCREYDIKVILDGVFSHTGADSIYFNKFENYNSMGAYNSADSPYFDWYNFMSYPDSYECWWGFENLPNVNEITPSYMEYIKNVLSFWHKKGISGWRLDVADELPDEFLDMLYSNVKHLNSEAFVIGEVWEDATNKIAYGQKRRYLLGGQMDSVMNYPWRTAVLEFVKYGDENLFNDRLFSIMENYPPPVLNCLMNSISTHDTLRAITYLGVDREVPRHNQGTFVMTKEEYEKGKTLLFLTTFLQFTLPGIPCIYYGDEVGLDGFADPYCRKTYPFGKEDFSILDFYKSLAKVRQNYKEEFTKPLKLYDMKKGLHSFTRGDLLCIINVGNEKSFIKTEKQEIVFEYGETETLLNGINLMPHSMIIIK